MHTSYIFIFFTMQRGIRIGESDGQSSFSFYNGFAVLWGVVVSNLSTVRFVAHQQHFNLLDIVDWELLKATGRHVLCFLVAPITNVGYRDLALESSAHPIVDASGFPPVTLYISLTSVRWTSLSSFWQLASWGVWGQLWCRVGNGCHLHRQCWGREGIK